MNKFLFALICLIYIIPLNAERLYLISAQPDSIYIRALEYYDESEDSSTIIEITYPKLFGLSNKSVEEKINSFLEEEFLKSVEWYEEFVSMLDSIPTIEYEYGLYFSFETGFDIKLLTENYLSIVLNHYEFTGGAHGHFYSMGYTFNLITGELLSLDKIISPNSINEIIRLCEQKILEMYDAKSLSDAGLFEDQLDLTLDQDYYLLPDALIFQFDPYEIAPYSMGNIEVAIPYEEIKKFIILKNLFAE